MLSGSVHGVIDRRCCDVQLEVTVDIAMIVLIRVGLSSRLFKKARGVFSRLAMSILLSVCGMHKNFRVRRGTTFSWQIKCLTCSQLLPSIFVSSLSSIRLL